MYKRQGPGKVTALSVAMTAAALFGFSFSHSFLPLCLWAVPYGLGAGSVDAALNNYVALHYTSRHMSWLHCMWGVGALSLIHIFLATCSILNIVFDLVFILIFHTGVEGTAIASLLAQGIACLLYTSRCV